MIILNSPLSWNRQRVVRLPIDVSLLGSSHRASGQSVDLRGHTVGSLVRKKTGNSFEITNLRII